MEIEKHGEVHLGDQQEVDESGFQSVGRRRGRGGRREGRRVSAQPADVSDAVAHEEPNAVSARVGSSSPVGRSSREDLVGESSRAFGDKSYPCGDMKKWYSDARMNNTFEMLSEGEILRDDDNLLDESDDEGMDDAGATRSRPLIVPLPLWRIPLPRFLFPVVSSVLLSVIPFPLMVHQQSYCCCWCSEVSKHYLFDAKCPA